MAKTQSLSLNPTKISGTCGRLMCCLKYEQDAYEDLIRNSPKPESFVDTPDGRGTVVDIELLRQRVKVRMEDRPEVIGTYANSDIAVLRNGKAKKTDPPIPADLAPISGAGKRVKKESPDEPVLLDPIRFRYSTESIVEEPAAPAPAAEEPAQETRSSRSRRRNRKHKHTVGEAQTAEKPQNTQKEADPAEKSAGGNAKKRRHNHRRRKPKQPGQDSAGQ